MAEDKDLEELEDSFKEDENENFEESVRSTDRRENAIEWYNGDDFAYVTIAKRKFIKATTEIAEKHPEEAKIINVNKDGTVYAKIPLKCIKIGWPREISEEQKEKSRQRLNKYWQDKASAEN